MSSKLVSSGSQDVDALQCVRPWFWRGARFEVFEVVVILPAVHTGNRLIKTVAKTLWRIIVEYQSDIILANLEARKYFVPESMELERQRALL